VDGEEVVVAANVVAHFDAGMKALENGRFTEAAHVLCFIGHQSSRRDTLCLCNCEDLAVARASRNLRIIEDRHAFQRASHQHRGEEEEESELHRYVCSKKMLRVG
jgi:hypothetical protein